MLLETNFSLIVSSYLYFQGHPRPLSPEGLKETGKECLFGLCYCFSGGGGGGGDGGDGGDDGIDLNNYGSRDYEL